MIDIERCRRAMRNLEVVGGPRPGLIEDAIRLIQESPETAMIDEYLGIKNYAAFGDQREDCPYNTGPRHGSIVFRIGRVRRDGVTLGEDEIYLLECLRDFGSIKHERLDRGVHHHRQLNLSDVIRLRNDAKLEFEKWQSTLDECNVESQIA